MDYEVVGRLILIAFLDAFKLRTGTEATVTAPTSTRTLSPKIPRLAATPSGETATYLVEAYVPRPPEEVGQPGEE